MGSQLIFRLFLLVSSAAALAACGGKVVFEDPGDGGNGAGGDPTTSTSPPSSTTGPDNTSSGPSGCTNHQDCGSNAVCLFPSGECVPACDFDVPCPDGFTCNDCGTSSCPECLDCLGACFPSAPVTCDDHLDCGMSAGDDVCIFSQGICAQRCGPGSPPCPPGFGCDDCATSSCAGCRDCVGACVMEFK